MEADGFILAVWCGPFDRLFGIQEKPYPKHDGKKGPAARSGLEKTECGMDRFFRLHGRFEPVCGVLGWL